MSTVVLILLGLTIDNERAVFPDPSTETLVRDYRLSSPLFNLY